MALTWPHALLFWAVFIGAALGEVRAVRRSRNEASAQDGGSALVIVASMQLATLLAFAAAVGFPSAAMLEGEVLLFPGGLALMAAGAFLRRHSMRMLDRSFTVRVVVRPGQPLVQRGAYRWIRHPAYAGSLLFYSGLGLALANWLSLGLLAGASMPAYAYRIAVEERALASMLGDAYAAYARRTAKLIPFLY